MFRTQPFFSRTGGDLVLCTQRSGYQIRRMCIQVPQTTTGNPLLRYIRQKKKQAMLNLQYGVEKKKQFDKPVWHYFYMHCRSRSLGFILLVAHIQQKLWRSIFKTCGRFQPSTQLSTPNKPGIRSGKFLERFHAGLISYSPKKDAGLHLPLQVTAIYYLVHKFEGGKWLVHRWQ